MRRPLLTTALILDLQRKAGNQAVARLLTCRPAAVVPAQPVELVEAEPLAPAPIALRGEMRWMRWWTLLGRLLFRLVRPSTPRIPAP